MELYDIIGQNYNSTRKADLFISNRLLYHLSLNKLTDGVYLDVGCGTGNYTVKLATFGLKMHGIDPSHIMLEAAKNKSSEVNWLQASAEDIPYENLMFDGALATLTIHHWDNLSIGMSEIYRVMKDSARFVIFTATPEQMQSYWLNHYFNR